MCRISKKIPTSSMYRIGRRCPPFKRNQCFGSVVILSRSGSSIWGWIPIRIQGFDDQKLKKMKAVKKLNIFWPIIAIYLTLSLHKGRPNYRRSLHLSKENIQHFQTWNFFLFLFLWALLDPDTDSVTCLNPDAIRIQNTERNPCESEDTEQRMVRLTISIITGIYFNSYGIHRAVVNILKGLSHEIDFKNVDKNLQNKA